MAQIDKKKLLMVLAFGIAGLLLINNAICLPISRNNADLAKSLKESIAKLNMIEGAFKDPQKIESVKKGIAELDEFLSAQIPEEKNVTQLTKLLGQAKKDQSVTIDAITSGEPREEKLRLSDSSSEITYGVLNASMNLKASFADLIKLLSWTRNQKRLISIQAMSLTPETEGNKINVGLNIQGYALSPQGLPFVEANEGAVSNEAYVKNVLSIPQVKEESIPPSDIGQMFASSTAQAKQVLPEGISELQLTGIVMRKASNIAVINNKLVRANDRIGNYRVVKVENDRVVLESDSGQKVLTIKK